MSSEINRYDKEVKQKEFALNKDKEKFIGKIKRDREILKINGGKVEIKTTPKALRFIKTIYLKVKQKLQYYYYKLILKIFS